MRLPDKIEKEIKDIEEEYDRRLGQHTGPARFRGLRSAIEGFLKDMDWNYEGEQLKSWGDKI